MFLLTILIPCYGNIDLIHRCFESLSNQTDKRFKVIIVDDCSKNNYEPIVNKFKSFPIDITRNEYNLGAVPNMIHCLKYPVETPFKMVFHEDDLLYSNYVEVMISIMTSNPDIGFTLCNMSFFDETPSFEEVSKKIIVKENKFNFLVENILAGKSISLASVIYKKECAEAAFFNLKTFDVLGDRPMLIELAKKYKFVYVNESLVAAYSHYKNDKRWKTLRLINILNLFHYYDKILGKNSVKLIKSAFTSYLVEVFKLLDYKKYSKMEIFIFGMNFRNFSPKYFLLTFPLIRKTSDYFKAK